MLDAARLDDTHLVISLCVITATTFVLTTGCRTAEAPEQPPVIVGPPEPERTFREETRHATSDRGERPVPPAQDVTLEERARWERLSGPRFAHSIASSWIREGRFEAAVMAFRSSPECADLLRRYGRSGAQTGRHDGFREYLAAYHPDCLRSYLAGVRDVEEEHERAARAYRLDPKKLEQRTELLATLWNEDETWVVRLTAFRTLLAETPRAELEPIVLDFLSASLAPGGRRVRKSCINAVLGSRHEISWIEAFVYEYIVEQRPFWQTFVTKTWTHKSQDLVELLRDAAVAVADPEARDRLNRQAHRVEEVLFDSGHRFHYQVMAENCRAKVPCPIHTLP